jgi:hypothetical protein
MSSAMKRKLCGGITTWAWESMIKGVSGGDVVR